VVGLSLSAGFKSFLQEAKRKIKNTSNAPFLLNKLNFSLLKGLALNNVSIDKNF
jgi:hypothetical protein